MKFSFYTFCLLLFFCIDMQGQEMMYDRNFQPLEDVKNIKEIPVNHRVRIVDRMYRINGSIVIEYYEQGTGRFLGFLGDPSKWEMKKLPYVKNHKGLKTLVKEHPDNPSMAAALYHEEPIEGMTPEVVLEAMGEPKERRGPEGSQIWIYEDESRVFFVNGVVFRFQRASEN